MIGGRKASACGSYCRDIHWLMAVLLVGVGAARAADVPDFAREIRPILSNHCFTCHGPDEQRREGDLRLDTREGAFAQRDGRPIIVPGKPDESELWQRLASDDPETRMPPAEGGKPLSPAQIELLRRWIEAGAAWSEHWSFVSPARPPVPVTSDPRYQARNSVDSFVHERLLREGLAPSPAADRAALLRRLSLDLTGLPPALDELDDFLADPSDVAFERQVDRLLASPHFGEKWGRHWLDAARYADSDGFEKDKPRQVWFYRDWVIRSLNADLPYDQFLIEQLAGDLLPEATQDQRVATGFLRNSMINEEGGVDPEQFRMEAMFDRLDAVGKSMLGLSLQCGQCHSHKYDPLTQSEYYAMFAFLNNSHEGSITVYTEHEQRQRQVLRNEIQALEDQLRRDAPDWQAQLAAWEASLPPAAVWQVVRPTLDASGGQKHYLLEDGSILAQGYAPTKHTTEFSVEVSAATITAFRLELLNDGNLPHGGPGRSLHGLCALSEFQVTAQPLGTNAGPRTVKLVRAWSEANPPVQPLDTVFHDRTDKARTTGPIELAIDDDPLSAWSPDVGPGRSNVPRQAVFVPDQPLQHPQGFRLTFRLQQNHGGWNSDDNQNNNLGRFRFSVTAAAMDGDRSGDILPHDVRAALAVPLQQRTAAEQATLFSHWRLTVPAWQDVNERIEQLWRQHPRGTSQLVYVERQQSRPTHRLERGNFLKPAEPVAPGTPAFLHPLTATSATPDRLDFARWLADRQSPTTARALVNRVWQHYFGVGLCETSEDLGSQGERPSHPELLEWLAVELMDSGWSQKHLHRLIVTSATYRQSSAAAGELYARDPRNRLLARGPRFRLDAEAVRDMALALSGMLDVAIGGPSVYPPAPAFLFQPPASYGPKYWKPEAGEERFRRAIYTFRFRSVPYPALQTFDAPNGDVACTRRPRSNTPLQALTTLNEPLFVECARALALRVVTHSPAAGEQIRFAYRNCMAREPSADELRLLGDLLHGQRQRLETEAIDPWTLIAPNAAARPELPDQVRPTDLACWVLAARVLLNLDETITKE